MIYLSRISLLSTQYSHSVLGISYYYAGRWDEAIASSRTALTLNPGLSITQYNIGAALLLKGEPQAALEAMQLEDSVCGRIGLPMAYHALGKKEAVFIPLRPTAVLHLRIF